MDTMRLPTRSIAPRALLPSAVAIAVICALGALLRIDAAINHDIAWMLVAAGRMLAGGTYDTDFFDVQMPLAIAQYMPPHALAALFGLSLPTALLAWVLLLCGLSAGLAARIVAPLQLGLPTWCWSGWLAAALVFVPGFHFAQKEHLVVALVLPFALARIAPAETLGPALRASLTALAACGCYLKPHYAGLPFLLLALDAVRRRDLQPLRSLEMAILLGLGIANGLFVVYWFPDWFSLARWAGDLYGSYRRAGLYEVLRNTPYILYALPALTACVLILVERALLATAWPLLVTATYGLVAYLAQFKGWEYQFLTVSLPLCALQFVSFAHACGRWRARRRGALAGVLLSAAGMLLLALAATVTTHSLPDWSRLKGSIIGQALAAAPPGGPVYVFSTHILPIFPTVVHLEQTWGSRFPSLWVLAGIEANRNTPDARLRGRLAGYARGLRAMVVADFVRFAPRLVLVDRRRPQFGLPPAFEFLPFFLAAPEFSAEWKHYVLIGHSDEYAIYARRATVAPENPRPPR